MRTKILTVLLATLALSCWSFAQASDKDASNPNGNISITSGPNVTPQSTSATITWNTSGRAATFVHYGTDPNNLSQKSYQPGGKRDHSVTLSNLTPGTTYYFAIMTDDQTVRQKGQFQTSGGSSATSTNNSGGQYTNANGQQIAITHGPILEYVGPSSAVIAWSTNVNADSILWYRIPSDTTAQSAQENSNGLTHRVHLNGLQPNTTYLFAFRSEDAKATSNGQTSALFQFTTSANESAAIHEQPAQTYTGAPVTARNGGVVITGPSLALVNANSAQIKWTTNAPSSSVVHYGTSKADLSQTAQAAWGSSIHQVALNNLSPNTTYYVQVESAQAQGSGAGAKSQEVSFQTLAPGASAKLNQPVSPVQ